ncbi:MAG: helix-turn-helix domain-containing protein [Clostridia bacterium]|nr:helix-turn-helix domain-containing protein [Clostridia bacterium]
MELREVLAKLKTENGLTTDLLSKLSGVLKGTLNKLLNGETKNPTGATLKKIADALNCPVEVLYDRSGEYAGSRPDAFCGHIRNMQDIMPVKARAIPMLGEIAAGTPIYAEESAEILFCDDSIHCDFALTVRGDSMIDARIHDGDIVFIRAQEDVDDGDIAAVVLNDEATLKRVYHMKNGLQLLSANPKYAPMVFTLDECDSIRILGKAVGFQGKL